MAKKTYTSSGLVLTKTGLLQYPRATPLDAINPISAVEPKIGDKIWEWSHTLRMSKNTVGEVLSVRHSKAPGDRFAITTITNLKGEIKEIYENVILTEEQYIEATQLL